MYQPSYSHTERNNRVLDQRSAQRQLRKCRAANVFWLCPEELKLDGTLAVTCAETKTVGVGQEAGRVLTVPTFRQ